MKKVILVKILILLSLFSIVSCKSKKEISIMIASSYDGVNETLYRSILTLNTRLDTSLILKRYRNVIDSPFPSKIYSIKNYKVYCEDFKDDVFLTKAIDYAKNNNVRLLIVATPEPVKNNPKEFDIYYKGIDLENNFMVYDFKSFYRVDLTPKGRGIKSSELSKVFHEIEEIINKLD